MDTFFWREGISFTEIQKNKKYEFSTNLKGTITITNDNDNDNNKICVFKNSKQIYSIILK